MNNTKSKAIDIALYGATGFTGQLVAEYLAARPNMEGVRVALAGRSQSKLEAVRSHLAGRYPHAGSWPLIVADSFDRSALEALCAQSQVVCTTVGPYAQYGAELVAACVREGADYCDLTGEVQFIRQSVDRHHNSAVKNGVHIVHCCGFDSIPSDLGTWMMHQAFVERGGQLEQVELFAGESRGSLSGGTVASMLLAIQQARESREVRRLLGNPYALYPEGEAPGPDGSDQTNVRFHAGMGQWTAPFVMAAINTRVVRRANALLGFPYGRDFRYSEVMSTGAGLKGRLRALGMVGALSGFVAGVSVGWTRRALQATILPKPGDGPGAEARSKGFFVIRLLAQGKAAGNPLTLRGRVEGKQDPGYGETAKMLGESALCLALDREELHPEGGVRTPASTMAQPLLRRLRAQGMVFEVQA